jgi:FtsH-binding integral membrane protein
MYTSRIFRSAVQINQAMIQVYNHMLAAIVTSFVVSALVGYNHEAMSLLFGTPLKWVVMLAPIAAIFGVSAVLNSQPSKLTAVLMLHAFAAIMGLSLSTVFVAYTLGSITSAFLGAGILFAIMSFYGYFTRKSLDSMGQFMLVGLVAVIIASLINIWVSNSILQMVISAIAVIVFAGLTAYDTQKIREEVSYESEHNVAEIRGAITLYLDFINMFINLLHLFGDRK